MPARTLITLSLVCVTAAVQAQPGGNFNPCGTLRNHYGPFDFRRDKDRLPLVENAHFTPQVEALVRGVSGPIGAEINYVLRVFPNHPRALLAMIRWGEKLKTNKPPGADFDIGCYFDRAVRFAPDDPTPRMLWAKYLHSVGQSEQAARTLDGAASIAGDNGFAHYNIGLFYLEINKPDEALRQAHLAAKLGFELPSLRAQLERIGRWKDPE